MTTRQVIHEMLEWRIAILGIIKEHQEQDWRSFLDPAEIAEVFLARYEILPALLTQVVHRTTVGFAVDMLP